MIRYILLAVLLLGGCESHDDDTQVSDRPVVETPTDNVQEPSTPVQVEVPTDVPTEPDPVSVPDISNCTTSNELVSVAFQSWLAKCGDDYPNLRPDCDPINGVFVCSNQTLGSNRPPQGGNDVPTVPVPVETPVVVPETGQQTGLTVQTETQAATGWTFVTTPSGHEGDGALIWKGGNGFTLDTAGRGTLTYQFYLENGGDYEVTVRSHITDGPTQSPQPADKNNDAWLRVNGGTWTKIFHQDRGRWSTTKHKTFRFEAGNNTVSISGRSQYFVIDSVTLIPPRTLPVNNPTPILGEDLYVVHYDVCPDRDDVHAMVANYVVFDQLGITNVLAAIGTCGTAISDRYSDSGESLFGQLYSDGINVDTNYDTAVATAAARWEEVLNDGHNVFVAEGGQSDFTAAVVRRINASLRGSITVVQHAPTYNEGNTASSNLSFLRDNVNYINIDNGNAGGNSTANLASWQQGLQDTSPFVNAALSSQYSTYWSQAFAVLDPNCRPQSYTCRIDFSDSVELLYLVGDTDTTDILEFANKYFGVN